MEIPFVALGVAFVVTLLLTLPARLTRDAMTRRWLPPVAIGVGILAGVWLAQGRSLWPIFDAGDWIVVVIPAAAALVAVAATMRFLIVVRWVLVIVAVAIAIGLPTMAKLTMPAGYGWGGLQFYRFVLLATAAAMVPIGVMTWGTSKDRGVVPGVLVGITTMTAGILLSVGGSASLGQIAFLAAAAIAGPVLLTVRSPAVVHRMAWTLPLIVVASLMTQALIWGVNYPTWHLAAVGGIPCLAGLLRLPVLRTKPWTRPIAVMLLAAVVAAAACFVAVRRFQSRYPTGGSSDPASYYR